MMALRGCYVSLEMSYENRRLMGIRGREKVENEFRQEIVCDLYIEVIESCKI